MPPPPPPPPTGAAGTVVRAADGTSVVTGRATGPLHPVTALAADVDRQRLTGHDVDGGDRLTAETALTGAGLGVAVTALGAEGSDRHLAHVIGHRERLRRSGVREVHRRTAGYSGPRRREGHRPPHAHQGHHRRRGHRAH